MIDELDFTGFHHGADNSACRFTRDGGKIRDVLVREFDADNRSVLFRRAEFSAENDQRSPNFVAGFGKAQDIEHRPGFSQASAQKSN